MYAALVTPGSARTSSRTLAQKPFARRDALVLRHRQRRAQRHDPCRLEAGRRRLDPQQSARISSPDETSSTTETVTSATTSSERSRSRPDGARARAFAQADRPPVAEAAQRGGEAEADGGHERHERGEGEDPEVERRGLGDRQRVRHEPRDERQGAEREQDAQDAPPAAARRRLSVRSWRTSALAPGAQRRPHRELLAPLERAGEKEARQVRARDQQHAERGAEEGQEEQPRLLRTPGRAAGRRSPRRPRSPSGTAARAAPPRGSSPPAPRSSDTPGRSRATHSQLQVVAPLERGALEPHRPPEPGLAPRKVEAARHDADRPGRAASSRITLRPSTPGSPPKRSCQRP